MVACCARNGSWYMLIKWSDSYAIHVHLFGKKSSEVVKVPSWSRDGERSVEQLIAGLSVNAALNSWSNSALVSSK